MEGEIFFGLCYHRNNDESNFNIWRNFNTYSYNFFDSNCWWLVGFLIKKIIYF